MHQAIVDRLKAQVTALKSVKGAAELAALDNRLTVEPAAFVVWLSDRPRGDGGQVTGHTTQILTSTYSVVLAVRRYADPLGGAMADDIQPLRDAVLIALLGWAPSGCQPFRFAGGEMIGLRDGEVWAQDRWITDTLYRGP